MYSKADGEVVVLPPGRNGSGSGVQSAVVKEHGRLEDVRSRSNLIVKIFLVLLVSAPDNQEGSAVQSDDAAGGAFLELHSANVKRDNDAALPM